MKADSKMPNNPLKKHVLKKYSLKQVSERLPKEYRKKFISTLKERSQNGKKKIRVYSDGCYDMFHFGHMRQLQQVKNIVSNVELVVGICADVDILKNKGTGVMNDLERVEAVRHCRHVDEVYFPAPWHPDLAFMDKHKFDYIAHDTIPYLVPGEKDCYKEMKEAGRFMPTLRTEGVSTSDLLLRILKDRSEYYQRNLKKGYSRKDMNLNYLEYLSVQMRGVLTNVQKCLKGEPSKENAGSENEDDYEDEEEE